MLSFEEARVVGAMVEKAMTTPDNYPMSLNAVVVACNQVSNRDPVVSFSEDQVELILRGLADRGLVKRVHRPGDRVVKYRHALDGDLGLEDPSLALIAVLLLRGAQTPGELRQRTQRYVAFGSLPELEAVLERLRHREPPLVARENRRPGHKENRYRHLLFGDDLEGWDGAPATDTPPPLGISEDPGPSLRDEVDALRGEVAELTRRLDGLIRQLGD